MKSKWLKLIATVIAVVLGVVVIMETGSMVWAQGAQNGISRLDNPTAMSQPGFGGRFSRGMMGGRFGGQGGETLTTIAKALNMTVSDLQSALQSGKTVADLAKAKNIGLAKVVDAILAERQADLKEAVAAKRITQAQADQILANMKANLPTHLSSPFTPRGNGMGMGMQQGRANGGRMFGGRGAPRSGMSWQHPFGRWSQPENNTQPNQ